MLFRFVPLKYDDSGERVAEAQALLRDLGSSVAINGEYTIGMESAVRWFQKKHGLPATGVIDRKTYRALKKAARKQR